jgi:predicted nucleic acid-binding protein
VTQSDRTPDKGRIFVDTSAFYALASRQDSGYAEAQRILRRIQRERWTNGDNDVHRR